MGRFTRLKTGLLAAVSLASMSAAAGPPPGSPQAPIEHVVSADTDDPATPTADAASGRWLAGGAVAAAVAGLIRLFGWRRISSAVAKIGEAASAVPAAAARYVAEAVKSPLRALLTVAGVSLFALVGVGLYDLEWVGGMATGAALIIAGMFGVRQVRNVFRRR